MPRLSRQTETSSPLNGEKCGFLSFTTRKAALFDLSGFLTLVLARYHEK